MCKRLILYYIITTKTFLEIEPECLNRQWTYSKDCEIFWNILGQNANNFSGYMTEKKITKKVPCNALNKKCWIVLGPIKWGSDGPYTLHCLTPSTFNKPLTKNPRSPSSPVTSCPLRYRWKATRPHAAALEWGGTLDYAAGQRRIERRPQTV